MANTVRLGQVAAAIAEWRAELINVDANNRLLYYKDLKVGTLNLDDADPVGLEQLRRGQTVRLGRLFPDPARLLVAQRSVRQIANKARTAEEEYGVPISFLAAGLATWDDGRSPKGSASVSQGHPTPRPTGTVTANEDGQLPLEPVAEPAPPVRRSPVPAAPVLLQAMGFEARPGTPDGYELTTLGEAFVNPVLVHVMKSQFSADVDETDLLENAGDDAMVFNLFKKVCAEVPAFEITERVLIGTFSYLKQPMVEDLGDDQIEFLAQNDLIAAIAGVAEAADAVRGAGGDVSEIAPDHDPPVNEFLVLDADASQSYVINAASAGQHLVVQGPPGTGKSQTIANLIADLVAHGKSVLFVAQKRAAITAVLHRLELVGLGGLTLDMFEGAGSRKTVVTNLGIALEEKANARTVQVDVLHRRWMAARDQLTGHQAALHEVRSPWQTSLWEMIAQEKGVSREAVSAVRVPMSTFQRWSATTMEELANAAAELASRGGNDPHLLGRSGWGIDAFESLDELTTAHELASHVIDLGLPRAFTAVTTISQSCGLPSPANMADLGSVLELLSDTVKAVAEGCGPALNSSLEYDALIAMIHATASKQWRQTNNISISFGGRRAGKKATRSLFGPTVELAGAHERLLRAHALRARWTAAGVPTMPILDAAQVADAQDATRRLGDALEELQAKVQGYMLPALPFAELDVALRELVVDPDRVRLPAIHQLRSQLIAGGLQPMLLELDGEACDPSIAGARVRYIFAKSLIDHLLSTDSRLAGITRAQLTRWAEIPSRRRGTLALQRRQSTSDSGRKDGPGHQRLPHPAHRDQAPDPA